MQIIVKIKNVYGQDKVYPVCEHAKLFAELAGTKTLTPQAIRVIKGLGYDLVTEQSKTL